MPEEPAKLDETLDAKAHEPPKRSKDTPAKVILTLLGVTVLAGLLLADLAGIFRRHGPHPGMQTRHIVTFLTMACESYRVSSGTWPWPEPAAVTPTTKIAGKEVCTLLRRGDEAHEDFLEEAISDLKNPAWCASFMRDGALLDEWGHEIMFRVDPKTGTPVIWSCGPDGKDDTNDGVSPDPVKFPKTYYRFGTGKKSDDITDPAASVLKQLRGREAGK